MKFKDKLIALLKEQAENNPDEYVNPHLLSAILSGLYDVGYLEEVSLQEQAALDKYVSDMWGY